MGNFIPAMPPSALPGISPTRGEIGQTMPFATTSGFLQASSPRAVRNIGRVVASLISPRVGEMAGRPEGGNRAHNAQMDAHP